MNTSLTYRLHYVRAAAQRAGLNGVQKENPGYGFYRPDGHRVFYAPTIREAEAFAEGLDYALRGSPPLE